MSSPSRFVAAALILWILVPLATLVCMALLWIVPMFAERTIGWAHGSPKSLWIWSLGVGVVYLGVGGLLLSRMPDLRHAGLAPRELLAIAIYLPIVAWIVGKGVCGFTFWLFDCASDTTPPQRATVEKVQYLWRSARLRISSPYPGLEFDCSKEVASALDTHKAQLFVHRGRLGVPWAEARRCLSDRCMEDE